MLVTQSCPILCDPMDCSLQGPSVHWILQARIREWIAIPFSRWSSRPRVQTLVSCIAGRFFTVCATKEAPSKLVTFKICFFKNHESFDSSQRTRMIRDNGMIRLGGKASECLDVRYCQSPWAAVQPRWTGTPDRALLWETGQLLTTTPGWRDERIDVTYCS